QGRVRVQAVVDGSAAGGAAGHPGSAARERRREARRAASAQRGGGRRGAPPSEDNKGAVVSHAESQTAALDDPHGPTPHARRAEADRPQRMSAVPRSQAAASGLPELRLLRGTSGQGGGGVVSRSR